MTDAEISRRLALAIGYLPEHVQQHEHRCSVFRSQSRNGYPMPGWYIFDHNDPSVIWPIAETYNCFPDSCDGTWHSWCQAILDFIYADTASKAVALAVIKASEAKK